MKVMNSRFDGWCKVCKRSFPAGTEILWGAGQGSQHNSCPPCMECGQVFRADGTFQHQPSCPTQAKQPFVRRPFIPGHPYAAPKATAPANGIGRFDDMLEDLNLRDIQVGGRGRSYFAIPFDGEGAFDGHAFFRIDNVDEAKDPRWGGNVFVRWVYGEIEKYVGRQFKGESGYRPLKDYANRFEFLLNEIATDPEKYKALYGQRVGKCGHCHKRLTDAESRRIGIGPICRNALNFRNGN
jgi:Family of unknown function (DUF6011)